MQKIIVLLALALMFPTMASAASALRCGTDAFGNDVCLDKDGVLITAPRQSAGERKGSAASGVSATEPKASRDDTKKKVRCAVDDFGNTVCSQ